MKISAQVLSALTLTLALGGCSTPSAESLAQNDPWEKTNRDVFDFDVKLDHAVAAPHRQGLSRRGARSRRATASTMP